MLERTRKHDLEGYGLPNTLSEEIAQSTVYHHLYRWPSSGMKEQPNFVYGWPSTSIPL